MKKLLKMKFVEGKLQYHFCHFEKLIKEPDALGDFTMDDINKTCLARNNVCCQF